MGDKETGKKLNGEAKALFEGLSRQRNEDRAIDSEWKREHNRSSKEFRDEIKEAITEIWKAMRNGFDKMSEALIKRTGNGTDWKMISIMISICLLIVSLLGARIISLEENMRELKKESRLAYDNLDTSLQREMRDVSAIRKAEITALDTTLQREMRLLREADVVNTESNQREIGRIRDWKDQVEQTQGAIDSEQSTEIKNIKVLLEAKASDRFTGSEGKMMQKHLDRLEERLSILTEQFMKQHNSKDS